MSRFVVTNKQTADVVEITTDEGNDPKLTPLIARRCALAVQMIPCWVSDGQRTYRVTKKAIVPKDISKLPFYLVWRIRNIDQYLVGKYPVTL